MAVSEAGADEAGDRCGGADAGARVRPWPWLLAWRAITGPLAAEQDRWSLWVPVLIGIGIALYFAMPTEPPTLLTLAALAAAILAATLGRDTQQTAAVLVTATTLCLALGFAAAKFRTELVRAPVLDRPLPRAEVRGFVVLVEPRVGGAERLTLQVTAIAGLTPAATPQRIRVRVASGRTGLAPGDAIRLRASLAAPAVPALPGAFDYARTAWFERLGAVGYAIGRAQIDAEAGPPPSMLMAAARIAALRQAIGARITAALPGEAGAIANALITGERGGISEATNQAYRDSGLFHVLSISGLHMVVMAGAVFWGVRLGLSAIPAIALWYPIKAWAAGAAILATLLYLTISGGAYATIRAAIMIAVMFFAVILERPAVSMRNVAVAATILLLTAPEALNDTGFQMSFAAVVALVAAYEALRARREQGAADPRRPLLPGPLLMLGGIVLTTLVASLATAPFAAYHFHKTQHYAILANLMAIPVCNIVVMPAALATLVAMPLGLEALPLTVMGWGIAAMSWCARTVAALPGAVGALPTIPVASFGLFVAGGLWLCLWQRGWRWAGLLAILAGVALAPYHPRPDLLVGRDALAVAVRRADGGLAALAGRGTTYEIARWLEHDGDARSVREVVGTGGFICDAVGCTARVKGRLVAIPRLPAALADDCAKADILLLPWPRPAACVAPSLVVDFFAMRDAGTHALHLTEGIAGAKRTIRVETVAAHRGLRPWASGRKRPVATAPQRPLSPTDRLGRFAAPELRPGGALPPRPEIEGEEGGPEPEDGR